MTSKVLVLVLVVETTHKASNKSLFFPLVVLSRESFPFPHKERKKRKK